jgi:hypothetical protein
MCVDVCQRYAGKVKKRAIWGGNDTIVTRYLAGVLAAVAPLPVIQESISHPHDSSIASIGDGC